jgi:6-pyruvoyltetrahydropterin/6-carboxytetrahydropterin synthase
MLVSKEFTFDSAHFLTKYHGKCEYLHGHTYKLRVTVEGEIQENGLVIDFVILKKLVKEKVVDKFDHRSLNDFFENPTAEIVAQFIWDELKNLPELLKAEIENPNLPDEIKRLLKEDGKKEISENVRLYEVLLWETADSFVTIRA